MSTTKFKVHEHIVPASHVRELPNALAVEENTPDATLHLAVKQYVPINNPDPKPGDINIIALHSNTFTKELYEPLWDDLLDALPAGTNIKSIWIADIAQQGASYVLNEEKLADGASWDDHSRDLLLMINHFRDQMTAPMIGIGHSMGGTQLIGLCRIHPRLFHAVAFLDGWFAADYQSLDPKGFWKRGTSRKDRFRSLDVARKGYEKVPVFKAWDRRVFERYMAAGFRDLPTMLHPDGEGVALTTPTAMEMSTATRSNIDEINVKPEEATRLDRLTYPDMAYDLSLKWPYYVKQPRTAGRYLPYLRPRALFLYGSKGSMARPEWQKANIEHTGTSDGGSGGHRLGCVEDGKVDGGHFFPFENPRGTAKVLAPWLATEAKVWRTEKEELSKRFQVEKPAEQRQRFPKEYVDITKNWANDPHAEPAAKPKKDSKL